MHLPSILTGSETTMPPSITARYDQQHAQLVVGWVSQPNNRGTIDIIWSCVTTIFACVWVMLHLNLPASDDGWWTCFLRKLRWFILALLAPELLMLFAAGQWASARRSVAQMKEFADDWTMVHAFYADSGGFILQARDSIPFPITARQVHYLVHNKYMAVPKITKEEILDKSKADGFAKTVAGLQSGWFTIQILARAVQHLPVTLLELSTIVIMTCTAVTLYFWFWKPLSVETPTMLYIDASVVEIVQEAGEAGKVYRYTPLDFAEPLDYTSSQMPLNRLWKTEKRPLQRIPNDRDSQLHDWKVCLIIAIPTAAFGTFQLIAWNFAFPTRTEQMLWRYTCLGNGIVLGVGCALEVGAIIASNYTVSGLHTFHDYKLKWPYCLLFFLPGFLYFSARTIVIVEVLISIRALPAECFVNVNWSGFIPHV